MAQKANQDLTIDASPTKDFFISMLVRDIELVDAIADLVDNCVDGARSLRPKTNDFKDLAVRIEATDQHFRIADNCGGIPVDTARNYAFRFGRPAEMPETPHSVGQFGIGMKRALFKMGTHFVVQSTTKSSRFKIDVDVSEWRAKEEWEFKFDKLEEGLAIPADKTGTTIEVTSLYDGVAKEFGLENFLNRLIATLASKHALSLGAGLAVTLNKTPLKFRPSELLRSDDLKPAYKELTFKPEPKTPVTVKLYVGIGESDPPAGGWYVSCNGRMVLEADKTERTGWGEGQDVTIPKYHNQFARFRGYAFFDCDDAALLPWNTSKTDMALDNPLYQAVRQQMIVLMRPVIDFLNRLKDEETAAGETGKKPLLDKIEKAPAVGLTKLKAQATFTAPKSVAIRAAPKSGRICYSKSLNEIRQVQESLNATSYREVGEKTFEYYLKSELKS